MKLTLVRHTTPDVKKGVIYGQTDVGLTDTFLEEAASVKSSLVGMEFSSVWSSPLMRCRRLASYCGFEDVRINALLKEIAFGEWEMKTYSDIPQNILDEYYASWRTYSPPGGESFLSHGERIRRFIDICMADGGIAPLVFTHGGSIAHFMILAGVASAERPFDCVPPFGSVTTVEF